MDYPRTVIIEDKKLATLLKDMGDLVTMGREKSVEIEDLEKEMAETDKEIRAIEKTVDISDLEEKAKDITERFNAVMAEMEDAKKEVKDRFSLAVPKDLITKYESQEKDKEKKENERNKIALKVQKFKDKIIPLGRKLMKPHLQDEFEDYDSLRIEDGKIVTTIFSHIVDFTNRYRKNKSL